MHGLLATWYLLVGGVLVHITFAVTVITPTLIIKSDDSLKFIIIRLMATSTTEIFGIFTFYFKDMIQIFQRLPCTWSITSKAIWHVSNFKRFIPFY